MFKNTVFHEATARGTDAISNTFSVPAPVAEVTFPAFQPIEPRVPIDKTRRLLPHWEQTGCTYFITYRLADAMPAAKLREWRWQLDLWLEHHPKPWYEKEWHEYRTHFEGPIQQWLDAGHGSCALRNPVVREIVVAAFHHHDGTRYRLGDYVIMPNHVHVLLTPHGGHSMREIVSTWKRSTGLQIVRRLRATAPFWLEESYDHIVRSEHQLHFYRRYIRENPEKASLPPAMWTHWAREDGA
jgi:REP element-mobilizing transposase RayT